MHISIISGETCVLINTLWLTVDYGSGYQDISVQFSEK